jgi:hypothetical protein
VTEFYSQDDDMDFWENMGQETAASEETPAEVVTEEAPAEDTAEAQPETEPQAEAPTEERPRDEKGRVLPKEETPEEPQYDPAVQDYLAKYGGDPEKALAAAVEAQRKIGEQGSELGELRRLIEERIPEQQEEQPSYDQDALAEWFETNPTRIPQVASQAAQQYGSSNPLYISAITAWREIDEVGATAFNNEVIKNELRTELQGATPTSQPWESTAAQFAQSHPDFQNYAPQMQEIAKEYEAVVQNTLQDGTPEAQLQVLKFLYQEARGRQADTLTATKTQVAQEAQEGADRAIQDAQVASATAVKSDPPRKSAADLIAEEWDALERPLADGWNVG